MDLEQKFVIKAQNELNETEDVRVQSLKDFRLWLAQHDYFADCRQGKLVHNNSICVTQPMITFAFDFIVTCR